MIRGGSVSSQMFPFCLCNQCFRAGAPPLLRGQGARDCVEWRSEAELGTGREKHSMTISLASAAGLQDAISICLLHACHAANFFACFTLLACLPACLLDVCGTRHGRERVAPLPDIFGGGISERQCFCIVLMCSFAVQRAI
jgi:hypothetical protein